jgi:hypothetical protein
MDYLLPASWLTGSDGTMRVYSTDMRNSSNSSFSINSINWMAAAVNRYYFCSRKIRESEAKGNTEATTNKWYREMFKAEDRMRALGI